MEYKIVDTDNSRETERETNKLLLHGWQLRGDLCVSRAASKFGVRQTYSQALVRPRQVPVVQNNQLVYQPPQHQQYIPDDASIAGSVAPSVTQSVIGNTDQF